MADFCKSKGFRENEIEWIEAAGASANKADKKYIALIEKIKATIEGSNTIKCVGFWHLNRLGRKEKYLLDMKNYFIENRIQVYVKEPSMTLLNEDGTVNNSTEIAWAIFATMIKHETQELLAKTKRGRDQNRKDGKFNGGAFGALYGYMVNKDGYIIRNDEEKELINDIYKDYAKGTYSTRSLAKEYRQRGLTQRDGRKITDRWLATIIQNQAYIGQPTKENRIYERIVEQELWDKVKAVREGKDLGIRKTKESRNTNLAIKLLKCKDCGSNYIATRDKYTCYKHAKKERFDEPCENSVSISIDIMDMVLSEVAAIKHDNWIEVAQEQNTKQLNRKKSVLFEKITESEKKIEGIEGKFQRAKEMYIDGDISKPQYQQRRDKINAEKQSLISELDTYRKEIEKIDRMIEEAKKTDYRSKTADLFYTDKKQLKEVINQHIESCYVKRVKVDGSKKAILIGINTLDWETNNVDQTVRYIYFYTSKKKAERIYRHSTLREGKPVYYYMGTDETNIESDLMAPMVAYV